MSFELLRLHRNFELLNFEFVTQNSKLKTQNARSAQFKTQNSKFKTHNMFDFGIKDIIDIFLVALLTSSLRTPKIFVKEFSYFLMPCHQHGLRINLLVQR